MASCNLSGNRKLFSTLERCDPITIHVANGCHITATQRGTIHLQTWSADRTRVIDLQFRNVYFHEEFSANLLSWGVLRAEGWELCSNSKGTLMATPEHEVIRLRGVGNVSTLQTITAGEQANSTVGVLESTPVMKLVHLHARLGHMSLKRMLKPVKAGAVDDMDAGSGDMTAADLTTLKRLIHDCVACKLGKGTRTAFGHRGLDHGSAPAEVLHMDSFEVRNGDTVEYGMAVRDPHSGASWFGRAIRKTELTQIAIDILRNAQQQTGSKVKRIYTDGGSEFVNRFKELCRTQGIELHFPPAATQQLNGVAERNVRTLKDGTRTLLAHAGLTANYWVAAMCHFVYIWNRTYISEETGITPHETLYKSKPSAKHWGVFGCDVFCHVPKRARQTFEDKMQPGIYLGHDAVQNCATVLLLHSGKIIRNRDVQFLEHSFLHARTLQGQRPSERGTAEAADTFTFVVQNADRGTDGIPAQPSATASLRASEAPQLPSAATDSDLKSETQSNSESPASTPRKYEVESLLAKRRGEDGLIEYQVKWSGYPLNEATWEPKAQLLNDGCMQSINDYEAQLAEADTSDEEDEVEFSPAAHMVMSALGRDLTQRHPRISEREQALRQEMAFAISIGVGLLEQNTPQTYEQAMKSVHRNEWQASMEKEIRSCEALGTWTKVRRADLPPSSNVLPCKWVYKIKHDSSYIPTEFKSRLTPKGFRQIFGQDYFDVFAPTGMYKTMRLGLSLAAQWDYELDQLDVPSAFCRAELEETVYMEMPKGFQEKGMVLKLNKSLYGLKQAPRNWHQLICSFLVAERIGFKSCVSDPCLFFKRSKTGRLIVLFLFVDDMQSSYHITDKGEWGAIKAALVQEFQTKDLGESQWILGMRITRDRAARTITLDQELYVTKAAEKYGLRNGVRTYATPELTAREITDGSDGAGTPAASRQRYMEIVGTLLYAAISTRPDISHAVLRLTKYMQAPLMRHMTAAERVLRYLVGTNTLGLVFGREGATPPQDETRSLQVSAYSDADWGNDVADRKSVTGWVVRVNNDVVSWASKTQRNVAQSTCEAELYAEAAAVQEVLWLRIILEELGLPLAAGSIVCVDNQSTIAISKNGIKGERTKHVDIKYHFVTQRIRDGTIRVEYVPTDKQIADIFTKALARPQFEVFRQKLMTG
jgi:hypothetical protein